MNFELIERVVVILFAVLFSFPHLCFCKCLFECVLYNIIGYNFDKSSMNLSILNVLLRFCLLYYFIFHIYVGVMTCHLNMLFKI